MKEVERIWSESRDLADKAQSAPPSRPARPPPPAPELKFSCPHCHQRIACDETLAGAAMPCPSCEKEIQVPTSPARQIAARLGMDMNTPEDAEMVRRVLLSTEASKIVLRDPEAEETLETELPKLLPVCAASGALLGVWTANQPGVSLMRDFFGREVWSSHSLFAHACAGLFVGLVTGFVLYWISFPIRWVLRQVAGKSHREKLVQFGLGFGYYLGFGLGGLIGGMRAIGANGTLLRGRFFEGFFFSHTAERGFLVGGLLGGLCLGLVFVLGAKLRSKRLSTAAGTLTNREHS